MYKTYTARILQSVKKKKKTSIVGREKQKEKREKLYGESGAGQAKKNKKAKVTAEGSEHTWLNTCPRGKSARSVCSYLLR